MLAFLLEEDQGERIGLLFVCKGMLQLLALLVLASQPQEMTFMVGGVERHALVAFPSLVSGAAGVKGPLIFAFHGHGGTMGYAARRYDLHDLWPEATVVYMQGLPSKGMNDREGTKNGWQQRVGDSGNRDVAFFDVVLKTLEDKGIVDTSRVYAMGHSNGGAFAYVVWATHPGLFAAIGSVAGFFRPTEAMQPVPLIHITGESDTIVPYRWQKWTVDRMRQLNGCSETGEGWNLPGSASGQAVAGCTYWPSSKGAPVVFYTYPGSHAYPDDASSKIIEFFKQQVKP